MPGVAGHFGADQPASWAFFPRLPTPLLALGVPFNSASRFPLLFPALRAAFPLTGVSPAIWLSRGPARSQNIPNFRRAKKLHCFVSGFQLGTFAWTASAVM